MTRTRRGALLALAALLAAGALPPAGARAQSALDGLGPAARQPCFGAPARDPLRPCVDPGLRLQVVPTPAAALRRPNAPCTFVATDPSVCRFGAPAEGATRTIALVGDSHAGHWRGAVDAVARARGWQGLSLTHSSCPLSTARRNLAFRSAREACARWKRQVFAWFARHPEVGTVFVAGLSGGSGVIPGGGRGAFETSVRGYVAAWRALPRTVRRIVVLRDTPKMDWTTDRCVTAARAARRPPGTACAVPRAGHVDPDPLVVAARRLASPRVRVVDLTRMFCSARVCFPVIGGALVFHDEGHMTASYAATLGPYLQREVDAVVGL